MQKNNIIVPIAILLAGALVAGAIYYSGDRPSKIPEKVVNDDALNIRAVDSSDHILGNPDAQVVIVEYSDTECPFCKDFHETLNKLIDSYGDNGKLAWVYRHFPIGAIKGHESAARQSEALECAAELGGNIAFWKFTDRLYQIIPREGSLNMNLLPDIASYSGLDKTAFESCLNSGKYTSRVIEDQKDGANAGIRGTPSSVIITKKPIDQNAESFINDVVMKLGIDPSFFRISSDRTKIFMSGAMPYEIVKQLVDILTL